MKRVIAWIVLGIGTLALFTAFPIATATVVLIGCLLWALGTLLS